MNKLEVGMYVRTKYGEIAKIDECLGKDSGYKNMEHYETDRMVTKFNNFILYKEHILKASHNIIDLIEVGDYVNGYKITLIHETYNVLYAEDERGYLIKSFGEEDIKSIVTKEQFESMEYRLGE